MQTTAWPHKKVFSILNWKAETTFPTEIFEFDKLLIQLLVREVLQFLCAIHQNFMQNFASFANISNTLKYRQTGASERKIYLK